MSRKVSIVVPVFNESVNIPVMTESIIQVFEKLPYTFEILFVDDGSSDDSLIVLHKLSTVYANVFFIHLSRNFGHQSALKAGLDYATGDCVISMDGDMQHPPQLIPELLTQWEHGNDVVYTRRANTDDLGFMKKLTSTLFYKILNFISDIPFEKGTADFRLIDRKVADKLKDLKEPEPFLRGLIKWVGFRQHSIEYTPSARHSGKSKYTFKKMSNLALQAVTSFTIRPFVFFTYAGLITALLSMLIYIPYTANALISNHYFPKWATIMSLVVFIGGIQVAILGLVGIYVGKSLMQTKERPNYIVKSTNLEPNPVLHDLVEL